MEKIKKCFRVSRFQGYWLLVYKTKEQSKKTKERVSLSIFYLLPFIFFLDLTFDFWPLTFDLRPVPDYTDENVSTKVVKIIQSYTGVVNKMVWRKY